MSIEENRRYAILSREYAAWNKAQGLNLSSADEHMFDEDLTDAQRRWLQDFVSRWDGVVRAAREFHEDMRRGD